VPYTTGVVAPQVVSLHTPRVFASPHLCWLQNSPHFLSSRKGTAFVRTAYAELPKTYAPITAHVGQTVKLPCLTNLSSAVDWWTLQSPTSTQRYVLASGYIQQPFKPRFNVAAASDTGDYTLYIFDAQHSDAGFYVCFEDLGLGRSHGYQLTVSGRLILLISNYT